MEYRDRALTCIVCGSEFLFTVGEQLFFAQKSFRNEPKHCKACKTHRNKTLGNGNSRREETSVMCSQCGRETTVPFKPTQGRPVFCRECFDQRRTAAPVPA